MKRMQALQLVSTEQMDRGQWLEVRRRGIGSSDAAAAVGLCPYKSPLELWMEKTGRVVQEDVPDQSDPRYWGTLLEPLVAAAYTKRTGNKVRRVNAVLQNPTFPYMLANIDREIVGAKDVQILECKTTGEFGARLWREGVPEYVQLQVQHQLAVTGRQTADVAVLLCGQQLEVFRIERDDDVIGRLAVLEAHFWNCVETDTAPAADGSDSSDRALRALFPSSGGDTLDFSEDQRLSTAFSQLVALRRDIDTRQREAELLKQILQQAMGDAARAVFASGEVSYKRAKDGSQVDLKRLTNDHPTLVASYTQPRPGSRRFIINGLAA